MSTNANHKSLAEIATELLNFIDNPLETFEDEDAKRAYQLQRIQTFLEMKFGYVERLQKEVENLRKERELTRPIVAAWSARQDLARRHPFSYLEEEG